jgi:hypothetical protein
MTIRATNPLEGKSADKTVAFFIINDHDDDAPIWTGGGSTGGTASSALPLEVQEPQTGASFTWGLDLSDLIDNSESSTIRGTTTFAIDASYSDGDKFTLDGDNLKFITAPDYENPVDDQGDNLYSVKLTATNSAGVGKGDSGGRSTQQVLYIQVTDSTADNTAQFVSNWDPGAMTIPESPDGSTDGYAIHAITLGANTSFYRIHTNPTIGANSAPFDIVGGTTITVNGTIDLSPETDTIFDIKVEAVNSAGVAGEWKIYRVNVTNHTSDDFDMSNPFTFTVEP